jgi:hypothetical protein
MLVMQYVSEEEVKASFQNGRTTDGLGINTTKSHSRSNTDDTWEVVIPK